MRHLDPALLFLLWACSHSFALMNITVDDQDPLIQYYPTRPSWGMVTESADAGGTHMLTTDTSAYAIITYTCVSLYFMSPLWPYPVTTAISLDGQPPLILDLQDHSVPLGSGQATASSRVVGWYTGTTNEQHTLRVSIPPGDQYAIVDMFIFEVPDESTTVPISVTTTQTATANTVVTTVNTVATTVTAVGPGLVTANGSGTAPSAAPALSINAAQSAPSQSSDRNSNATSTKKVQWKTIGMGIGLGLLGLLLLLTICCLYSRRTRRQPNHNNPQMLDPSDYNVWGRPAASNSDGTEGVRYTALPMGGYTSPTVSNAPNMSERVPLYTPTQMGGPSQWSPQRGDGFDGFDGTSSGVESAIVPGPASSGASAYSDGREMPNIGSRTASTLSPRSVPPSNVNPERQSGSSWDSGQPQPLRFIPIV